MKEVFDITLLRMSKQAYQKSEIVKAALMSSRKRLAVDPSSVSAKHALEASNVTVEDLTASDKFRALRPLALDLSPLPMTLLLPPLLGAVEFLDTLS